MSNVDKIENAIRLLDEKELLEKKLANINSEIKLNQDKCSHIGGFMGTNDAPNKCKCLLCNKELSRNEMLNLCENNLIVYAGYYLIDKNPTYEEKFQIIQTMFLGLSKNNRNMSNEEIVDNFNNMIDAGKDFKIDIKPKTYKKMYIKYEIINK